MARMRNNIFASTFLVLGLFGSSTAALAKNAVLLSKVDTLTLREDRMTSHRRVPAIPQLKCTGGHGCKHYSVDVMQCKNSGYDYDPNDVAWTCTASLPPEFKLGSTDVICEGYSNSDDPAILKGSCGVEYRLLLTDAGMEKYGLSTFEKVGSKILGEGGQSKTDIVIGTIFWALLIGVFGFIAFNIIKDCLFPSQRRQAERRYGQGGTRGGYGGGGGGGDGYDDPPPPYDPYPPSYSRPSYSTPKPRYTRTSGSTRSNRSTGSGWGWRPGFWTGAATGAATGGTAGYYAGSRSARNQARNDPGVGSSRMGGSGSSSSSAPSSSRYSSTGFGSTSSR